MSEIGDDTEDKIRRNLVAFSSIIILGAWFGIPLAALADKALAAGTLDKVAPWRVWSAVVAVMVYLILRFRFAGDTIAAANALRKDWAMILRGKVKRMLARHLARFSKSGRDSALFSNTLTSNARRVSEGFAQNIGKSVESLGAVTLEVGIVQFLGDGRAPSEMIQQTHIETYRGSVHMTYQWSNGGASSGDLAADFEVKGWTRFRLRLTSLWTLTVYSPAGMKLILPSGIAAVAFAIAAFKLGLAVAADIRAA